MAEEFEDFVAIRTTANAVSNGILAEPPLVVGAVPVAHPSNSDHCTGRAAEDLAQKEGLEQCIGLDLEERHKWVVASFHQEWAPLEDRNQWAAVQAAQFVRILRLEAVARSPSH